MCRPIQSILQSVICALQMVTRIFMTVLLMLENTIRMLMQSIYNFISTILQVISLIPICCVFLLTAKLKCVFCGGGGGGGCSGVGQGGPGGIMGCVLSILFLAIFLFLTQRIMIVDKIMLRFGYENVHRTTTKDPLGTKHKFSYLWKGKYYPSTGRDPYKYYTIPRFDRNRMWKMFSSKMLRLTKHPVQVTSRTMFANADVKGLKPNEKAELYADIDPETLPRTTIERPLESFKPATKHHTSGNWSTILYYLL